MWTCDPFTKGQAWADLLMLANYQAGHVYIRGTIVEYERGEIVVSERFLNERWAWSKGKVRRFLDVLETRQRIVTRKSSLTSIIAITNYDEYQSDGNTDGNAERPPTVTRTDHGRTADSNADGPKKKEVKKERSKEVKKKAAVAAVLPGVLDTDRFRATWTLWEKHRVEIKKPVTAQSAKMSLKQLANMGHDPAIAALEYTIAKGWQGIREPEGPNNKPAPRREPARPCNDLLNDEEKIEYNRKLAEQNAIIKR
jgi:hypothetical protein